jgi:hypothetical protein
LVLLPHALPATPLHKLKELPQQHVPKTSSSTRNFSSDSRPGTLSGPTQHISGEFSFDSEHELTGFINHG